MIQLLMDGVGRTFQLCSVEVDPQMSMLLIIIMDSEVQLWCIATYAYDLCIVLLVCRSSGCK